MNLLIKFKETWIGTGRRIKAAASLVVVSVTCKRNVSPSKGPLAKFESINDTDIVVENITFVRPWVWYYFVHSHSWTEPIHNTTGEATRRKKSSKSFTKQSHQDAAFALFTGSSRISCTGTVLKLAYFHETRHASDTTQKRATLRHQLTCISLLKMITCIIFSFKICIWGLLKVMLAEYSATSIWKLDYSGCNDRCWF